MSGHVPSKYPASQGAALSRSPLGIVHQGKKLISLLQPSPLSFVAALSSLSFI